MALVAALSSDVELLLFDEPTSGLDPLMEEVFQNCVAEEKARGRTVLLSSHILAEVEALCDRVSIIRNGRTVETGDRAGAIALGVALAVHGWFFAAVGAVAAQLTQTAPGARWIAVSVLGVSYLLRAAGDSGGAGNGLEWLSWLSPTGVAQRVRPFADERWWLVAVLFAAGLVLAVVTYALSARRDIAAGLLPERLGPAEAARSLRTPLALAWRLHRGAIIGWTAGYAAFGAALGGAAKSASDQMSDNADLEDILARLGGTASIDDAFLAICF